MSAAIQHQFEVVDILTRHKDIHINQDDNSGSTVLIAASLQGHPKIVQQLLSHSEIDVNHANGSQSKLRNKNINDKIIKFYKNIKIIKNYFDHNYASKLN